MRIFRCLKCFCGFAIHVKRGKNNRGTKGVTCPLCQAPDIEEVDTVREIGGALAAKALDWWKSLPSGD